MIEYARSTIAGRREKNEDSCHIPLAQQPALAIVADGMGGHNAGSTASQMAVSEILTVAAAPLDEACLRAAIRSANLAIYGRAKQDLACRGMGTTLVLAALTETEYLAANIGDSRLYRFSNGCLTQISEDHSYVAMLVATGKITRAQARTHPRRNLITRALGTEEKEEADYFSGKWDRGDLLLLCSDGLHGSLSEEEIIRLLSEEGTLQEKCDALLRLAFENGSTDNITVVLAHNKGGEPT